MARGKALRPGGTNPFERLREAWHEAERWPLAGSAFRQVHDAETRALMELKARLAALDDTPPEHDVADDEPPEPAALLADLMVRGRGVDPDRARDDLYRQILGRLVPDQIGMLRVLARRGKAPLCDIGGSRLPAASAPSVIRMHNASSLGQESGVLLREFTPYYMTQLLALGLVQAGPADDALEADYELMLADPRIRQVMDEIRQQLGLYPRVIRRSVTLSPLGEALWRDCLPAAEAINAQRPRY